MPLAAYEYKENKKCGLEKIDVPIPKKVKYQNGAMQKWVIEKRFKENDERSKRKTIKHSFFSCVS